jgi:hypothetical protein
LLEKEYEYFQKNANSFIKNHPGEFVVIKNEEVKGFFPTEIEAFESMKNEELGTFIIQHCSKEDIKPQEYHSRAIFV